MDESSIKLLKKLKDKVNYKRKNILNWGLDPKKITEKKKNK